MKIAGIVVWIEHRKSASKVKTIQSVEKRGWSGCENVYGIGGILISVETG